GPDAEAVPGEHELLTPPVVEREGELAVQALEQPLAPLLPAVHEHLGVRARAEAVAGPLELLTELDVVEDLAVEDDQEGAVLVAEGLRAAGQVDDAQARVR